MALTHTRAGGHSRLSVLCIVGDSRSGSTLLQALLGAPAGSATVGELRRLGTFLREERKCSCGQPVPQCGYWSDVLQRAHVADADLHATVRSHAALAGLAARMVRPRFGRALAPGAAQTASTFGRIYRAVSDVTGARVVVDASKDPRHFFAMGLQMVDVRPLLLHRDGRAVVHSKVRRAGLTYVRATDNWVQVARVMSWIVKMPDARTVTYEDVCGDPAAVISSVLGRLGVVVAPGETMSAAEDMHFLGGSPGFSLADAEPIHEDTAWRREASPSMLAYFERKAGARNRALGYRD